MPYDFIKAHEKIKSFDWEPSYAEPTPKYHTRFVIPKKGQDPFRHLMRDYMRMEAEKDSRQYGFMDGAVRMDNPNHACERWVEALKVFLAAFPVPEYTACKCMGLLIEAVDNQELRQGYLAQMLDEMRHFQQFLFLNSYFTKHYRDPEGFNGCMRRAADNFICTAARGASELFCSNDPIDASMCLQVIGETAFTNPIFVGLPRVAVLNGDHSTPSVMLSIQSDESRHMGNGYATLCTVLTEDRNVPLLQETIDHYFWRLDRFVGAAVGYLVDYAAVNRGESYREMFKQWVVDDWVGSYIGKLEKFGLRPPTYLEESIEQSKWISHTTAAELHASWPLMFWRMEVPNARDIDWLEQSYPGWSTHYGKFWDEARRMTDPAEGALAMQLMPALPPFCQVCMFPCVYPRPDMSAQRIVTVEGKRIAFCSEVCQWIYELNPQRYNNYVNWYARFDGWDLADVIMELGYVRRDGKTLLGQPTLDTARMWTIDDIRRVHYTIRNPLA